MSNRFNTSDLLDSLKHGFRNLRLSLVESVFLVTALLFAGGVTFIYLNKIQPRYARIEELRTEKRRAQDEIERKQTQNKAIKTQQNAKSGIVDSLDDFEERLRDRATGTTQMIGEINQLSRAHHLLVQGYNFNSRSAELVAATPPAASPDGSPTPTPPPFRLDKDLKIYPSLGIDTALEGEYHDLRRFIYDLERSRQFLIINTLSFQGVDEKVRQIKGRINPGGGANLPDPTKQSIALKIEMDAYFEKPEGQTTFMYPASSPAANQKTSDAAGKKEPPTKSAK